MSWEGFYARGPKGTTLAGIHALSEWTRLTRQPVMELDFLNTMLHYFFGGISQLPCLMSSFCHVS